MQTPENPIWTQRLPQLYDAAWAALLPQAVSDRLDARLAMLATLGADGGPEVRGVVLRAADPARGTVDVFTDGATQKCREIEADPRVALTLWREDVLLQIRLRGTATLIDGPTARTAWEGLPDQALPNYGVTPTPGSDIPAADAYQRAPERARFGILRVKVETMDVVSLHEPTHSRAFYERRDGFRGAWRAP